VAALDGACVLDPEYLDGAIIGVASGLGGAVAVYDYDLLVQVMAADGADDGADEEAETNAIEWIEFNTLRALPYMGLRAPIVVYLLEEGAEAETEDSGDTPVMYEFGGQTYASR